MHIAAPEHKSDKKRLLQLQIERYGGKVMDRDTARYSHLIVLEQDKYILARKEVYHMILTVIIIIQY